MHLGQINREEAKSVTINFQALQIRKTFDVGWWDDINIIIANF
jgi:hypothetical protein